MGATYKLKHKKADGTIEDVALQGQVHFIPSDAFTVVAESTYNPTKWSVSDVNGVTAPTDGMTIAVRTPNNGSSYGTMLSINGGNNYFPIVRNLETMIGYNHYLRNSTLILTFNATQVVSVYNGSSSMSRRNGCWQVADLNDDKQVVQSYDDHDTLLPLLLSQKEVETIGNGVTAGAAFSDQIYANPSTGTIYANDFVVDGQSIVGGGGGSNIIDLPNQYVRIWDLDTGIYRLTYDGAKRIYYNGATSTYTIEVRVDKPIFYVNKYIYNNTLEYRVWSTITTTVTGNSYAPAIVSGYCNETSGSYSNKTIHEITTNLSQYIKNNLTYDTSNTDYALSAYQGYVLEQNKQNKADNTLQTTDKTIVGAINEVNNKVGSGIAQLQQSVTYAELKALRDNGELVAGMQYRITDFVTTTSQPDTQSAGHPFDIIVTALSNTTLSENASADYHIGSGGGATFDPSVLADEDGNLVEGSVIKYYDVYEDCDDVEDKTEDYKSGDIFVGWAYGLNDDGVLVPILYKNDIESYGDEGTDYGDTFYYVGTEEYNGTIYDKWRKIEDSNYGWDSTGKIWALTNVIVNSGSAVDPYFANSKLPAWEIKYCLDNDKTRFAWAADKQMIVNLDSGYSNGAPLTRQPTADGNYDANENPAYEGYHYAWGTQEDADDEDRTNFWYSKNEVLTNGETVIDGFGQLATAEVVDAGKGVIYYMKDEWDNECHYDFKNILFKRSADWFAEHDDWGENVLGYTPTEDKWFYTFTWVDENDEPQDLTLIGNSLLNDEGKIKGVFGNKIGLCSEYQIYLGENSVEALSYNVFVSSYSCEGGIFYGCDSNTFGNNCYSNTFGYCCRSNSFGINCNSNTFGNECDANTFGNECCSNTFGYGCNFNTFGINCNSNTFGDFCFYNTFGNGCRSNTFGNDCPYNTFGDFCSSNTFGYSCPSNTFGNDCNDNILSEYTLYNIFENGVQYVELTSTTQGASNNLLQNITVSQGIKGTSNDRKTINATRNADYQQIFRKSGSQEILVD